MNQELDASLLEVLQEFVAESLENLTQFERLALNLEEDQSAEKLGEIFRVVHSMKGSAGFFELQQISQLSHLVENLLAQLREGRLSCNREMVDAILSAADLLREMLEDPSLGRQHDISAVATCIKACMADEPQAAPARKEHLPVQRQAAPAPPALPLAPNKAKGGREAKSMRISVEVLDELLELIGEVVLSRNQYMAKQGEDPAFSPLSQSISKLHRQVIQTRMQPIGSLFDKFNRVVRDLARKLGKEIELVVEGADIELDRTVLEKFSDPLTHLIRNAVDHGIDLPQERAALGKPSKGTIHLRAYHQAGQIILEVEDDGRGIDPDRLKAKAMEKGLFKGEAIAQMNREEALNLIFHPGFSTAEATTDISGRGVGMDVVRTNFEGLGCQLDLSTKLGKGTRFSARMPLTQAIVNSSVISALIVRLEGYKLAIPQMAVNEMVQLNPKEQEESLAWINGKEVLRLREEILPVVPLHQVLGLPGQKPRAEADKRLIFIVLEYKRNHFAVPVDQILGTEEIVVKKIPRLIKHRKVFDGTTILSDGVIAMILNLHGVVEEGQIDFEKKGSHNSLLSLASLQHQEEGVSLVVFANHPAEEFALPVNLISQVHKIHKNQIHRMGSQQFVEIGGRHQRVIHLEDHLDMTPKDPALQEFFVILPPFEGKPAILASRIVETLEVKESLDLKHHTEPGILGRIAVGQRMVLLVDLFSLLQTEPEPGSPLALQLQRVDLQKARILLVEDTLFFRHLVTSYFRSFGLGNITLAKNGREALEILNQQPEAFDLVISDVEMPEMDGLELVGNLKADPRFAALPALALTGLNREEDRQKCLAAGFDAFEVKIDKTRVIRQVTQMLHAPSEVNP